MPLYAYVLNFKYIVRVANCGCGHMVILVLQFVNACWYGPHSLLDAVAEIAASCDMAYNFKQLYQWFRSSQPFMQCITFVDVVDSVIKYNCISFSDVLFPVYVNNMITVSMAVTFFVMDF